MNFVHLNFLNLVCSIFLLRSSSTPTYTHCHGQTHYSPHTRTTPSGLSNGRRTPSPGTQQQHTHQISGINNSSPSSASRTSSSLNSNTTPASGSSSGSSASGKLAKLSLVIDNFVDTQKSEALIFVKGGNLGNSRLLVKIKRFLGTLLQFGADISPEIGDRVRALVFSLVVSGCH